MRFTLLHGGLYQTASECKYQHCDDELAFIQRTFYVDIIKCALHYYTGDLTRLLVSASSNPAVCNQCYEGKLVRVN